MTENLTTKQVVIRICIIIALVELLIMLLLSNMPIDLHSYTGALLDTILLSVLSTPFIYLWIIKPFVVAHDELAFNDALTGLPNRRMIFKLLEQFIAKCARHNFQGALLLMDLDDFKSINDNYGHDAGDAVLVEVSNRLISVTRPEDVVGRLGGDEFIILIAQLDTGGPSIHDSVRKITTKLQDAVSKPFLYKDKTFNINSSIGICHSRIKNLSVKTAIKKADIAMYKAKQERKGFSIYSEELLEETPQVSDIL